jgi:hypothetical protein
VDNKKLEQINNMYWIYRAVRECVVRIIGNNAKGDPEIGTGFHIGQGYFVTARHVVEDLSQMQIKHTEGFAMIESITVKSMLFPRDPKIDLAVLKTDIQFTKYYLNGYGAMPGHTLSDFKGIPLGSLIDDAVSDHYILREVLLMGFPKIPLSDQPELVAVRGEINATVRKYIGPSHYFHVISTVARGGFSGGPVIDDDGFLLGVFTESLTTSDRKDTEIGFAAVLSIEPLLILICFQVECNNPRPCGDAAHANPIPRQADET